MRPTVFGKKLAINHLRVSSLYIFGGVFYRNWSWCYVSDRRKIITSFSYANFSFDFCRKAREVMSLAQVREAMSLDWHKKEMKPNLYFQKS